MMKSKFIGKGEKCTSKNLGQNISKYSMAYLAT